MHVKTANLVHPVLRHALYLLEKRKRGEPYNREREQATFIRLLGAGLDPLVRTRFNGTDAGQHRPLDLIQYALVCMLDELFVADPEFGEQWNAHKIETKLWGTNDRALNFWAKAQQAETSLGGDVLEAFQLCALLGFRGELRDKPERLAEWVEGIQARRPGPPSRTAPALPEPEPPPPLPPLLAAQDWPWRWFGAKHERTAYPEIDAAYGHACSELRRAVIDLKATPRFLVLGRSLGGAEDLFRAAFPGEYGRLLVRGVPAQPDALLRVFATTDAVYICANAGSLARQSKRLADAPPDKPMSGEGIERATEPPLATLATLGAPAALRRISPAGDEAERRTDYGRLRRLCQLLADSRGHGAPLNGILVLLPFAATGCDDDARQTAHCWQRDLNIIRETLQLRCPVFALVCDLETAPGFGDFLERFPHHFPRGRRDHRLGQSFPPRAVSNTAMTGQIADTVRWLCEELIPGYINGLFEVEKPGKRDFADAVEGNRRLYLLWHLLREHQQRLTILFTPPAVRHGDESEGAIDGCYLAATGGDPDREQGFVAGVFQKLFACRNRVAWTQEALKQDHTYQCWSLGALAALGVLLLTAAALVWAIIT